MPKCRLSVSNAFENALTAVRPVSAFPGNCAMRGWLRVIVRLSLIGRIMNSSTDSPMAQSLREPVETFIRQKKLEVTSPASVKDIVYFTNLLVKGLTTLFPEQTLSQVGLKHLLAYVEWLESNSAGHRMSKATIKRKAVMYARHMFARLHEDAVISVNPAQQLRYRKRVRYQPTPRVTREHLALLDKALESDAYLSKLMRAIVHLLLDTGIRNEELCNLVDSDLDLAANRINIRYGKGGSSGRLGFGANTHVAIQDYLTLRAALSSGNAGRLFVNSQGRGLTKTHLAHLFTACGKRAGIPRLSPHQLRVTFAVELFLKGESPFTVQAALRHKTLDMTYRYMRLAEEERTALRCSISSVSDELLKPRKDTSYG